MSRSTAIKAVVMGGSAGALEALSRILPALPGTFPWPILVVVHLPPDKKSSLAELLDSKCSLSVREALDKEMMEAGSIYIAPPDYHLLVETNGILSLSYDEPELFSRPSIDVLFESAADAFGEGLIGIILSGANNDGARGLKAIAEENGMVLVQTPTAAYAQAMPAAALEECPNAKALSADELAEFLIKESLT